MKAGLANKADVRPSFIWVRQRELTKLYRKYAMQVHRCRLLTKGLVEQDEEGAEEALPGGNSSRLGWDDKRADEVNQWRRRTNWICALR
jgi:hypothetical protein